MDFDTCIKRRRDTRHFLPDDVPDDVLQKAIQAAHLAPSVGLSEPWRFVVVRSVHVKDKILTSFNEYLKLSEKKLQSQHQRLKLHKSLKLEAITSSPLGIAVFCEESLIDDYVIGAEFERKTFQWSVSCAIQNLWLSLTSQGYSLGWVSILDLNKVTEILQTPPEWKSLGYLCIGKPATHYDGIPMLEQKAWRKRSRHPVVHYR